MFSERGTEDKEERSAGAEPDPLHSDSGLLEENARSYEEFRNHMKKIFLSHYERYVHLDRFVLALRELVQIEPILLENCPKVGGTPPRKLAEHYMKTCDGVLFLLTSDTQTKDKHHPSVSVSMELIIAEQLFPIESRFYLLERDTTFPPMAQIPTYISFSWDDIIPALVDLRRALESRKLVGGAPIAGGVGESLTAEEIFLLEAIAGNAAGYSVLAEVAASYQQRFQRDYTDFNILVNGLRKRGMVHEEFRLIGSMGLNKVRVVTIGSQGLRALGQHREVVRARKAQSAIKGLETLGLIR